MSRKIKASLSIFVFLSISLHLFTLGVLKWTTTSTKIQPQQDLIEFEITEAPSQKRLQVIEQDEFQVNDEEPEDARFLGRHNQRVVKETRAKNHGDFKNSPGEGVSGQQKNLPSLSDLNPHFNFNQLQQQTQATNSAGGPSSATNDHLKDVESGIETLLSSKEFVYYSYYQRIRAQIRQHWEPSIREKVRRIFAQGRTIASARDHVTRVIIVLNPQGELLGVKVIGPSGVQDLDEAAVEAFKAAQPFPNPPQGIVDADGTIKINWDFILEV